MKKHICKTSLIIFAGVVFLNFTACAKSKAKTPEAADKTQTQAAQPAVNPEIEKLNRVLLSMTDRCKAAIPNGDPEEFLADLHKVLEVQKNFRKDDLSLYYLIDKKHSVSADYVPKDLQPVKGNDLWNVSRNDLSLRPEAYAALEDLSRAALNDGIKLMVSSTYRSYQYQEGLFNRYVKQDGLELAERYSARPGTSQHQLGVAIDFGSITDDWGDTKMGKWVYEHASEFGWSLSFPKGYEDVTGYMWECWHFRYHRTDLRAAPQHRLEDGRLEGQQSGTVGIGALRVNEKRHVAEQRFAHLALGIRRTAAVAAVDPHRIADRGHQTDERPALHLYLGGEARSEKRGVNEDVEVAHMVGDDQSAPPRRHCGRNGRDLQVHDLPAPRRPDPREP